jgi:hypothetical protein
MAKRRAAADATAGDQNLAQPASQVPSAPEGQEIPAPAGSAITAEPQETPAAKPQGPHHAPIAAPPKGQGPSYTIDHIAGYRKEDVTTADGRRRRQIRFAERPDDEMLEPVRKRKPAIKWDAPAKGWQARVNEEGLEAIDSADQELAETARKRTGVPPR